MSKEIGTLVVVVLKARNLPDKHSFYKQDVFAQITLHSNTKKTAIDVKGGQHPMWDEELRFPVYERKGKGGMTMEVSCWSKEPRSDDLVGKGELDITETLRTGEFDGESVSLTTCPHRTEFVLYQTGFHWGLTMLCVATSIWR